MGNVVVGDVTQVIVGPARLLVAPAGTALPLLDGTINPVVFDVAFKEVGYTDDGVSMAYAPTVKDIMVDEVMSPVQKNLDGEKCTITAKLAQATLDNLYNAISAAIKSTQAADATHAQTVTIDVGTGVLREVIVAFEGLSPKKLQRIFIGYRAIAQANVTMAFKRSDKTIIPLELSLLADSTKALGKQVYTMVDFLAPHTP